MGWRTRASIFAGVAALLSLWLPGPALAAATPCDFHLGFKAIHDQLPAQVGACVDNETYNSSGDSVQHTAGGMLAWRHADNWTAFTDGYHTWVNGPSGLQERLNSARFPWEHDMDNPGNVSSSNTSTTSTTSRTSCSAVASSGSVSATGLNSSTTIISDGSGTSVTTSGNGTTTISSSSSDGNGTTTTVITNSSTSSSTPGVATSGC